MRPTSMMACRIALGICVAFVGCVTAADAPRTIAAATSTWYWQNPLPREYFVSAIACPSLLACVAVGNGADVLATTDGGQHWTDRPSGTDIGLQSVSCPGPDICYALGSEARYRSTGPPKSVQTVIIRSDDRGNTWQQPAAHLPTGRTEILSWLTCPSASICLAGGYDVASNLSEPLLRTADSGRTWQAIRLSRQGDVVGVTCTGTICYALINTKGKSNVARSPDSGKTWRLGLSSPPRLANPELGSGALACPAANTCFATALDCGFTCNVGHIYVTRDGARTWRQIYYGATGGIACPSTTICYASVQQSVARTTNGGKTWSVHHVPDHAVTLACPGPTTCYVTSVVNVLKTSDGFGHTQETLAHSVIHDQSLTDISCPTTTVCYAAGSRLIQNVCDDGPCEGPASFAATTDAGSTWHTTPPPPVLLDHLSCPEVGVCLAVDGSGVGPIAVVRSDDGTRTWHQIRWQQVNSRLFANNQAWDIACIARTTCYMLARVTVAPQGNKAPVGLVAVLVSHNTGRTWSTETGMATAALAGGKRTTYVTPDRISCPGATTCFVLATVQDSPAAAPTVVLMSTTDGGTHWTRHFTPPGTAPDSGYGQLTQDLSCPTTTTCFVLTFNRSGQPGSSNGGPGPVLVTRDAGATWHKSVAGSGGYLDAVSCATAQSCRVAGSSGIFGTDDGGVTWQRELLADGTPIPSMVSISCPAVDTCYAVGGPEPCCGIIILGTHSPGALRPVDRHFSRVKRQASRRLPSTVSLRVDGVRLGK